MGKKYLISYQRRDKNKIIDLDALDFRIEVEGREEADQKVEDLQAEGYQNIIIEEIRE